MVNQKEVEKSLTHEADTDKVDLSIYPLEADKRGAKSKKNIVKPCPECGKPLRAKSEKQWEYVLLAHKTLSKKHRVEEEKR